MIWLRWALARLSYAIRPYDMLSDRRRWRWQRRTPCGWPPGTAAGFAYAVALLRSPHGRSAAARAMFEGIDLDNLTGKLIAERLAAWLESRAPQ